MSDARIKELQQIQRNKSYESKCNWAVTAYNDWRAERLRTFNYDYPIYSADLNDLVNLQKENLEYSLCRFVPEVTRKKGEGLFPGKTLYQMVAAIQKYLTFNKIYWKLVDECEDLKVVLDNVMQERAKLNIRMVPKQADLITYEFEETMWEKGILGEDKPDTLSNTVIFLLGINCCLRAVEDIIISQRHAQYA